MNPHDSLLSFKGDVFGLPVGEKQRLLTNGLKELTSHHIRNCQPYAQIIEAMWPGNGEVARLEDAPWLPVRLFKLLDLHSVPASQVHRTLLSSGTTGSSVSRIYLDEGTAKAQSQALIKIFSSVAGRQRMPMLVVDDAGFLKNRGRMNARAAAILGFAAFGRDHLYLLDERLEANWKALEEWVELHCDKPVLVFGFTFVIWQSLVMAARQDGRRFRMHPDSLLVHGGGWKRLEEQKVSNGAFKEALQDVLGLERVHNYYGMVEQVGSIFVECERGYLHAPAFADILVRDVSSLAVVGPHVPGLIQVLSLLPRSYPGHSLLTEDIGVMRGEDDCACGRLGKYFEVLQRVKNVELRGCSDTRVLPA